MTKFGKKLRQRNIKEWEDHYIDYKSLKQGDRTYQYFYDANSNLIKTVDSMGYECSFTYDALNRAVSETNENGAETGYSYDALGRITSLTDALGNTSLAEYDLNGNLKRMVTPRGGEYLYNYNENLFTGPAFSHIMSLTAGRRRAAWKQTSRKTSGHTGNSAG